LPYIETNIQKETQEMKKKYIVIIVFCIIALIGTVCLYYANMPQVEDKGEWVKLQESQKINGWRRIGDKIYGGDIDLSDIQHFDPLKGVDAESFTACKNSKYAKDKNHVYFPIVEIAVDAETWGGGILKEYIVDGASPNSFKYLGDDYGVDGYTMYRMGEKVKWDKGVVNHYQNHEHRTDTLCPLCKMEKKFGNSE